jgi:glycerol-3-phosphate acyltransferase PlsY
VGLGALVTWLLVAVIFRYSSLAALFAATTAPIYITLLGLPREWIIAAAAMTLLLIYRHKSNIQNLMSGKESRIGQKKG